LSSSLTDRTGIIWISWSSWF